MAKQTIWFKKRTTRGSGRAVTGRTRVTPKNASREMYKNQRVYALYLLKFVLFFGVGLVWLRMGTIISIASVEVVMLPIGALIGLLFLLFEKFRVALFIEILLVITAAFISYFTPVGFIL